MDRILGTCPSAPDPVVVASLMRIPSPLQVQCALLWYIALHLHLLCFERIIGSEFKTGGRHAPRYVVEFVLKDWLYRVQFMCSLAVGLQIG